MSDKSGDTLDKILGHLESLHTKNDAMIARQDAMSAKHDALSSRMDALEGTMGAMNQTDAERQARPDAAEKESDEKARADAAAKSAIDEDRAKYADAQMRADAAYQAWGKQAPHALHGESLRDFQIRLLTPLKQHSKTYKDSALNLVGDDTVFSVITDAIINDAVTASNDSVGVGVPLQKRTRKTESGHIETRWVGDPAVAWGQFMGGATKFGRINADMANKAPR